MQLPELLIDLDSATCESGLADLTQTRKSEKFWTHLVTSLPIMKNLLPKHVKEICGPFLHQIAKNLTCLASGTGLNL